MHPKYSTLLHNLEAALSAYDLQVRHLPGLLPAGARQTLAMQFVESERKQDRIRQLAGKAPSLDRLNPGLETFDPELAAVASRLAGNFDEACWLVFLSVHFGRHKDDGWELCRQIYGGMGPTPYWTWDQISQHLSEFRGWLNALLVSVNQPLGRFGNHRKYESLSSSTLGLAAVIESYVAWVSAAGGHSQLLSAALHDSGGDPRRAFGLLYERMRAVLRFGRLARFDYLTMLSKLGLAPIDADATYLAEATGPKRGAKLLFEGSVGASATSRQLEDDVARLAAHLNLGMQTMEDALCNWQKSPTAFIAFRG